MRSLHQPRAPVVCSFILKIKFPINKMSKFRVKEDADELVKHSTFLVTINPNMAYTDADELLKARAELKGKVDTIFGENMDQYLVPYRVTPRGNVRSDMSIDEMNNYIIDGEIESRCEIGKIKKRLHCHTVVKITHKELVFRMNLQKIRQDLGPYIRLDVKFVKDHTFDLVRYIRKNM